MAVRDELIGKVIENRYRVIRLIGEGGMGVVYEVEHILIGRRFALKRLDPSLARNQEVLERFQREARAAAAIGDEHIIEVSDMGRLNDGSPYIVMELLEGSDLGHGLEKEGPLSVSRAVRIAKDCCNALGAAHEKGIIHRDVKPDNIFLTKKRDGTEFVKILDFGISKFKEKALGIGEGSMTKTGIALGTPHYMSPEQVRGDSSIDARTDVYAMGVVLFQMLAGRVPFQAETYPALVIKIVSDEPPSLLSLRSDIPAGLEQVVRKSLSKDPEKRHGSIIELGEALTGFSTFSGKPQLTESGLAFTRTITPKVWERIKSVKGTSALGSTATKWSLFAIAAAVFVGVYFLFAGNPVGNNLEKERAASPNVVKPAPLDMPVIANQEQKSAVQAPTASPSNIAKVINEEPKPSNEISSVTDKLEENDGPSATKSSPNAPPRGLSRNDVKRSVHKVRKAGAKASTGKKRTAGVKPTSSEAPTKQQPISLTEKRTIAFTNYRRARVNVSLKCGTHSMSVAVSANGRSEVEVFSGACEVICSGVGHPICPPVLGSQARSLEIR